MVKKSWHANFKRAPKQARTNRKGRTFHSKAEMQRHEKLQQWLVAGYITDLVCQPEYMLVLPNGTPIKYQSGKAAKYTPDFEYTIVETGERIIEEVKGYLDDLSKLRIAIFEACSGRRVKMVRV